MPSTCRLRLYVAHLAGLYWPWLLMLSLATATGLRFRFARRKRKEIARRIPNLVKDVLALLQEQEHQHYTNPSIAPYSYIPALQLRDKLLADEYSSNTRARIWGGVEESVESNANVRVREVELRGDIWRVWEWVGGVEQGEPLSPAANDSGVYPKLPEMTQKKRG